MANETRTAAVAPADLDPLDQLAFKLFSETPARRAGEREVVDAYRRAELFLATRKRFKAGELKPADPAGPQLATCCAPNLPRNHPLNLVAAVYQDRKGGAPVPGDLAKVARIKAWLDRAWDSKLAEAEPEQLVARLARDFPELGWDLPTIDLARVVFPAYCK